MGDGFANNSYLGELGYHAACHFGGCITGIAFFEVIQLFQQQLLLATKVPSLNLGPSYINCCFLKKHLNSGLLFVCLLWSWRSNPGTCKC
jgi:hypothetical protein